MELSRNEIETLDTITEEWMRHEEAEGIIHHDSHVKEYTNYVSVGFIRTRLHRALEGLAQPVLWIIGQETPRLQELRDGGKPTDTEILELWHMAQDSEGYVGGICTMMDFGQFLTGLPEFESTDQPAIPPATITW